jgi:regulator of protease activity HflC (stomatin/prohibitin superfamily)
MNMTDPLASVRRATAQRAKAEQAWREAIRKAHQEGQTMRAIAKAAHISPTRVHQITTDKED